MAELQTRAMAVLATIHHSTVANTARPLQGSHLGFPLVAGSAKLRDCIRSFVGRGAVCSRAPEKGPLKIELAQRRIPSNSMPPSRMESRVLSWAQQLVAIHALRARHSGAFRNWH